eukprot:CAMPEP_0195633844 /NCGR_PEP_ID=MMETSP0815-20121206/22368_1 /TAXON_ID=97485 /ORGANISM="Prymnesium parvum, Strain Texoma1" /LENGTH=77 /DNA_ID=CAMNT_0040775545 /DNA_START=1013 /DNA_END=1242 /DNA_ORIENTATION=-
MPAVIALAEAIHARAVRLTRGAARAVLQREAAAEADVARVRGVAAAAPLVPIPSGAHAPARAAGRRLALGRRTRTLA